MDPIETIRTAAFGKMTLRLVKKSGRYFGTIVAVGGGRIALLEGVNAEDVWRDLQEEAGKAGSGYFGFAGARAHFLHFFPAGFADPRYAAKERTYKLDAKNKLDKSVPLSEAVAGCGGFGAAALAVVQDTNLLAVPEKIKIRDLLRGPSAAAFVRAAACFASGGNESALLQMERILRPHDCDKWTIATYLPFLWRPDNPMFLKPDVTRNFAARVGIPFVDEYEPRLGIGVYNSLQNLVRRTKEELAGAELHLRDHIDVQSFIWVVETYTEADAP